MWNLAVIAALYSKKLSWEEIKMYRVDYSKSKEFGGLLKRNSGHE
jgi:hypothetical protein